ncbi:MAG: deaminase [Candidatus Omnitrophica bacterium]|nr:deaminase [Candidatus Omnitrophota bacterium]
MKERKSERIECTEVPAPIGPYSQAVRAGDFLFISGQIPIDPGTGRVSTADIEGQTALVIDNIEKILSSCGLELNDVVKADVFLNNMENFPRMNDVYGSRFTGNVKPARCVVQVSRLPKNVLIELSCIALAR